MWWVFLLLMVATATVPWMATAVAHPLCSEAQAAHDSTFHMPEAFGAARLSYVMHAWSWSSCTCGGFSYSSWLQQQLFLGWQQLLLILCARKHKQRMVALFICQRHSVPRASPTSCMHGAGARAHVGLPNPQGCSSKCSLDGNGCCTSSALGSTTTNSASPTSCMREARARAHEGLPNPHGCSSEGSLDGNGCCTSSAL